MPVPSDFKNVSAEMKYIQPVMTSNTTWSNNPSFGMEVHTYGYCGTNRDDADRDWGVRESWWPFSGISLGSSNERGMRSRFLYCYPKNDLHSASLKMIFPTDIKFRSFTHQQVLNGQGNLCVGLYAGEEQKTKLDIPNINTPKDGTRYTHEIPTEKQVYNDSWNLLAISSSAGWANGCLWLGNNCEINAVWNPTHIFRPSGVFERDYQNLYGISAAQENSSSKTFLLDTLVKLSNTLKVELDFTPLSSTVLCGAVSNGLALGLGVIGGVISYNLFDYSDKKTSWSCPIGERHTMSLDAVNSTLIFDEKQIKVSHNATSFNTFSTITLFGRSDRNGFGNMILHGFKVWDGENLISDMIPVRRRFDGVNGLYDKISKSFFKNTGPKNFIAHE